MIARLAQLLVLLTLINYSLCNCKDKLKRCEDQFFGQMKQNKYMNAHKSYMEIYYNVCSTNGIYSNLVNCVRELSGQCENLPGKLCDVRGVKMSAYRYTWKPNLIHDVCHRTVSLLDQDFFKHEKCASEVLNSKNWVCDLSHYTKIKQTNGPQICLHWQDFRNCIFDEVKRHCGEVTAKVSDFMFHTHSSYFSKYQVCNFTGESYTKCWYDLQFEPEHQEETSTTTKRPKLVSTVAIPSSTESSSISEAQVVMTEKTLKGGSEQLKSSDHGKRGEEFTTSSIKALNSEKANSEEEKTEGEEEKDDNNSESNENNDKVFQNDSVFKPHIGNDKLHDSSVQNHQINRQVNLTRESKAILNDQSETNAINLASTHQDQQNQENTAPCASMSLLLMVINFGLLNFLQYFIHHN